MMSRVITTCFGNEFLRILVRHFNTPIVIYEMPIALLTMVLCIVYVMKCVRRISAVYWCILFLLPPPFTLVGPPLSGVCIG